MNLLVLIIASDNLPVYLTLQALWKKQFHCHPNIDMYFIKCDPNLAQEYTKTDDTIYTKGDEDIYYNLIKKTLMGIKVGFIEKTYDYVLRTNLSSFYIFSRLMDHLQNCPRENYYGGITEIHNNIRFVSGCGFVISHDIALHIMDKLEQVWKPEIKHDDVCIGQYIDQTFFPNKEFQLIPRLVIRRPLHLKRVALCLKNYPHFRIKYDTNREKMDVETRSFLLHHFYPALH